jgi:hypothetical protein
MSGEDAILRKAQEKSLENIDSSLQNRQNNLSSSDTSSMGSVLDRSSKMKIQTELAKIKELISLDINSESTKVIENNYKNSNLYESLNELLKNYKIDNNDFEYSYINNKISIKYKADPSYSATGTLSSDGKFSWDSNN